MQEVLKKLFGEAVTDEALLTFNAELGKKFVSKADFNTKKDELKIANDTIKDIREELQTLKDNGASADDWKTKYEELDLKMKNDEEAREKEKADAELTSEIEAVIGDKKFTSEYARQGVISEMKTEIAKKENKSKGYAEIFEMVTKDKEGIFANPNPPAPDMPGMGKVDPADVTKEQFAKMGYKERVELYNTDKDTYNKLKE